jgi:Protein of unknown function (DUF3551)
MRPILMVIVAATTVLAADASRAQESFFNKRYCSVPGGSNSGSLLDCSYNTMEQCRASAHGTTRYCSENRNWKPDAATPRTRKPARG